MEMSLPSRIAAFYKLKLSGRLYSCLILAFILTFTTGLCAADPFEVFAPAATQTALEIGKLPLEELTELAKKDNIEACYELAYRYYAGKNVVQDTKTAMVWFNQGAKLGDPAAQTTLGVIYLQGKEVTPDANEAIAWFEKAAAQNFPKAQYNLGIIYLNGNGVEADNEKAFSWLQKAAFNNDGQGQYALACMYLTAQGVTEDYLKAYKWLLIAEYNDVDVKIIKDMVEKTISPYEKQKALEAASDFVAKIKAKTTTAAGQKADQDITDGPVTGGTGFFITKDGYILTAYHIIRSSKDIRVQTSLGLVPASLVLYDSSNDFALLKIEGYINCKTVPLAGPEYKPQLGSPVWTFGYRAGARPQENPDFVSGKITALFGQSVDSSATKPAGGFRGLWQGKTEGKPVISLESANLRFFQLECNAGPGNAGGAVIDNQGAVIGIFASEFDASEKELMTNQWTARTHFASKLSFILPYFDAIPGLNEKIEAIRQERKLEEAAIQAKNATVAVFCY
ncbi:MAG: SEL1-like repeat protein [Sedimentisphaerales bacterium]|nr:SEL1-like repeat protein [Sedimentisphaerales bacterium]MBN2843747.1 SEL1-like repeat protein [Sedimentisphaerales bacterium]